MLRVEAAPAGRQGLNADAFEPVTVTKKMNVSQDTVFVRFAFKDESAVSGLTIASCLLLRAPLGDVQADGTRADVIRPYTPITAPATKYARRLHARVRNIQFKRTSRTCPMSPILLIVSSPPDRWTCLGLPVQGCGLWGDCTH